LPTAGVNAVRAEKMLGLLEKPGISAASMDPIVEFLSSSDAANRIETLMTHAVTAGWLKRKDVASDGHCFFYAVIRSLVDQCTHPPEPSYCQKVEEVIGADVMARFASPTYEGTPKDAHPLRSAVLTEMQRINNAETDDGDCFAAAHAGAFASEEGSAVRSAGWGDIDCSYVHAVCNLFGIGVAVEYPSKGDGGPSPRRWKFTQPGDVYRSLDKRLTDISAHNELALTGTQTDKRDVKCSNVIYLRLQGNHFMSYLYIEKSELDVKIKEHFMKLDEECAKNIELAMRGLHFQTFGVVRSRAFVSHVLRHS
jgi:hypothetical protein